MMITIHGLPPKSKYQDVKALIKQECKITDFILDNLVAEPNGCKKVRVGLTDDDEGYRIMKCLDGYRCSGNFVLSVLPVGKTAPPNAPMQNTYDSRGTFQSQPRNDYPPAANYGNQAPQGPHRSMDMPSRPAQWNANHQSNQWNPSLSVQVPQNTFGYQQNPTPVHQNQPYQQQHASQGVRPDIRPVPQVRGPPEQSFGFSNKSNVPDLRGARQDGRPHVLRSVEILDVPANPAVQVQGRYPPNNQSFQAQEKPGPSPYMAAGTQPQGHFQGQGHAPHPGYGPNQGHAPIQPWVQPQAQVLKQPFPKPTPRQYDKPYHDERKYPQTENRTDMKSNEAARISHDSYKKYDSSGRPFSPQRMDPTRRHSPPGRPIIPSDVRISPPGRRISPSGRGISAPGRRVSPSGRRISPPGRRISPSVRRISPPGRRISPPGRRISPPGRRISPPSRVISATDRNTSLSGRPISPTGRGISGSGRLVSPPGRRASPPGRVISPSGRRLSPSDKRMAGRGSPERRLVSPTRRDPQRSTMPMRFSPSRHQDKSSDKYGNDIQKLKQVRPAYEPTTQAPNQSMYSGGYRPNISDVQYPITGPRQVEQSSWQQERDKAMYSSTMKKLEEERRDISRAQVRGGDQAVVSPRASRSPLRRDRSPIRDRFKRHSPSPRSPRRSWALEKRRSPEVEEAPPPPIWPGQSRDDDFPRHARPEFTPRVDKDEKKHVIPPWERPNFDKEDDRARRPVIEEMRPYGDERVRRNIPDREPARTDRFPIQNPKVPEYNREEFERERRGDFRRQSDVDRKPYVEKRDFRDLPRQADREDHHRLEPVPLRRDSPVVELGRKDFGKEIDRDFEDIYKKALEFKKRAEELRKSGEKKREVFSGEERSRRDDDSKYYENRRETESRYQDNRDDRHDYRTEAERHIHRPENSPERPLPTVDHYKRDDALQRTKRFLMPPAVKVKRDKAVEDLSKKIMDKHLDSNLTPDQKLRIREELRLALARILFEMFGDMDVSFIEIVIKYQAKYNEKDEHKILRDVMSSMPSMYRNSLKRPATESSAISPKSSRWSPPPDVKKDEPSRQALNDSVHWHVNLKPPQLVSLMPMQMPQIAPHVPHMTQVAPMMVPAPRYVSAIEEMSQNMVYTPEQGNIGQHFRTVAPIEEGHNLYICKDDFEPFSTDQAEKLKNFLVSQIIKVTETSQGWAPDFTLKGLQSLYRYELSTKDENSRDWLLHLDFSEFEYFNVLVYNKEELWYERAAIWLPGHSRSRLIEPLEKLKLQNQKLAGVNIGKWKSVKKVINQKGTRLYVDMPPSSARALEKHKMMLSYELQKVNVYLKAVAVDKDSFDSGLKEPSLGVQPEIIAAEQNSPIPPIANEPTLLKITLKGSKSMSAIQARKIKEMVVYHLFKYHQQNGKSRTDFLKYGFLPPAYVGVVPENTESKRWLMSQYLGKLNRQPIVVLGGDEENIKYMKMDATIPSGNSANEAVVLERIKQSNQGVKGSRSGVYYANQQSRKEYEDYKKDVTFRPKPQRPYQRVIEESNPEYRTRSSGQSELRPKMRHEANVKPRIRPEYKMRPESEEEVERARHQQMNSSENKTDHRAKFDTKPKTRQEVYSERKVRHETYTEPERKLKPEIRENPEVIRAEKKDRPENKLKTDIIRSDQMAKRVNTEPKEKPEIVCQQKVEEKVIAPLATIDEGATPIEDIIEEQLPVAKPTGQHYELNPLMSRMVEVELRDIMIKIWQELPDNSLDEGEKLVADKLRNIAGDDIRNVLGLNVTKRLLNVFNPLFVKIQFSGKPDRVNLAKFLRKYNFIAFKRIGKADVFAAQMKSIKDFDRICSTIDIMCGDVKVTVNPCYRFTKCPPNLKTSYDDKSEADVIDDTADPEKHKQGSYTDVTVPKLKSQQNTAESNIGKTVPSLAKSVNVCQTKQSETNGAKMKVDTKSDGTAEPKIIQSETDCKTVPIINSEKNVPKINPAKSGTNVVKPSPAKPDKNVATSNTEKAKVETKIDSQNKSNEVNNKNKLNESKVPDGSGDGNETVHDELDEADMFALISEGIVLDECSGSDEE